MNKIKNKMEDIYPKDINIVGILECTSRYKYGFTSHNVPLYIFYPLNDKYPPMLVASKIKDIKKNYLVLVKYMEWKQKIPRGIFIELIGECGDFNAEKKALRWQYCPNVYKKDVKVDFNYYDKNDDNVYNLEDWMTINIDPENCDDIDDCVSFRKIDDENLGDLLVAISITNVANYVKKDSEIDKKAFIIGKTFYSDEKRSMLPKLYEDSFSLNVNEKRYAVSLIFKWNISSQKITEIEWKETKLINKRSYSYESKELLEDSDIKDLINFMKEFSNNDDPKKWIESLMIFYNTETAKILSFHKKGIFRRHDKSTMGKINIYEKICPFLAYKSAEYCLFSENKEEMFHYGLNSDVYLNITSPIRRYSDLYNQRILIDIINNSKDFDNKIIIPNEIIDHLNQNDKLCKRFEKEFFLIETIQHNDDKIIEGIIVNILEDKIKIYVEKWKRIISTKLKDGKYELYQNVEIKYHYNPNQKNWKDKIVFEIRV